MSQINEIEIGGVVYDLAGSGSGGGTGYSKTVLWTGNSAPSEITFESSLKDYDLILFEGMLSNGVGNYTLSNIYSKEDIVDNRELGVYSNESYLWYHYAADSDTITLSAGSANNVLTNIIGIKFSGGSGEGGSSTLSGLTDVELDESPSAGQVLTYDADSSKWINANVTGGTNVVANPEDLSEDATELTSLRISDSDYKITFEIESVDADKVKVNVEDTTYLSNNTQGIFTNINKGVTKANYYTVYRGGNSQESFIKMYNSENELLEEKKQIDNVYGSKFVITVGQLSMIREPYKVAVQIIVNSDDENGVIYNGTKFNADEIVYTWGDWLPTGTISQIQDADEEIYSGASFINFQGEKSNVQEAIDDLYTKLEPSGGTSVTPNPEDLSDTPSNLSSLRINEEDYIIDLKRVELTQSEYDALVEAGEVQPDVEYFIKDSNGGAGYEVVAGCYKYTDEEIVIGEWKDGRPIYRSGVKPESGVDFYLKEEEILNKVVPKLEANDTDDYLLTANTESNGTHVWWAFNDDTLQGDVSWYSNVLPAYCQIQNKKEKIIINYFEIWQETQSPCYFKKYSLQASNDGETWTTLGEFDEETWLINEKYSHSVNNNTAYYYYRFSFTERGSGSTGSGVSIQCIKLYNLKGSIYEYVKTTDEENSFEPSMICPTKLPIQTDREYSTDEKVVGKWIDGLDIYEKTIVINSLDSASENNLLPDIMCADLIDARLSIYSNDGQLIGNSVVRENGTGSAAAAVILSNNKIYLKRSGTGLWAGNKAWVNLQYTKCPASSQWIALFGQPISTTDKTNSYVTYSTTNIMLYFNDTNGGWTYTNGIRTNNKVDLSQYSHIKVDYTKNIFEGYSILGIVISDEVLDNAITRWNRTFEADMKNTIYLKPDEIQDSGSIEFDLTDYNEEKYIYVVIQDGTDDNYEPISTGECNNSHNGKADVTITNISLT